MFFYLVIKKVILIFVLLNQLNLFIMKIFLALLFVALLGSFLVGLANHFFGVVNVFIFSVVVTVIVGVFYVPYMQYKNRKF